MDFSFGGWLCSMHQPADWDYTSLLPDMFAPDETVYSVEQQQSQQQQAESQEQQLAMRTANAAPAVPTYAAFHGTGTNSMHQPVDWDMPVLFSMPPLPAPQPSTQSMQAGVIPVKSFPVGALVPCLAAPQQIKETGTPAVGGGGSNKRARGGTGDAARCGKSTTVRPQQQQMLELQKKLDALLQQHAVMEAENERLKTRLRVLEAVLPVRQQNARWAQSKASEAAATARNGGQQQRQPPEDPILASLIDLATSGPSSCATSPTHHKQQPPPVADMAAGGCGNCACGGDDAAATAAADECAAVAMQGDSLMPVGSPPLEAAAPPADPAPCASSSCATSTTTTSGTTHLQPRNTQGTGRSHHGCHHHHGRCPHRSCSFNTGKRDGGGGGGSSRLQQHHHRAHHQHSQHTLGCCSTHRHKTQDPQLRGPPACASLGRTHSDRDRDLQGCSCAFATSAADDDSNQARWLDAWRSWVREAALLLQAHDARPNDHYLKRLEEAFMRLKAGVVHLGLRHPELVCNMRGVNMETGAEMEFPPDSFWSLAVAGMKLDAQQVANCKSALALYRERMAVVLPERRSLAAAASSCLTTLQLEEADGRAAPGSMRREQLTLEAEEAAAALDANVAAEGHTTSLARDLLGSNLFSRLQVARASVLSYPYFPDALAILTAAVGEHDTAVAAGPAAGASTQQQQQQQPASRSTDAVQAMQA